MEKKTTATICVCVYTCVYLRVFSFVHFCVWNILWCLINAMVLNNQTAAASHIMEFGFPTLLWRPPRLRQSPGEGNGSPLQYSCLENPLDRGAWRATVHRVAKSLTPLKWLRMHTQINKIRQLNWEMGKRLNKHFKTENVQMVKKYLGKCSS